MNDKIRVSAAIITKNEQDNLPACLQSLFFADDIVVVDSGSTDRTTEIAKEFGCRVFVEDWKGYGPQKNSALNKCRHEWALIIDADERIPDETRQGIINVLKSPAADAYSFPRKNYLHNKWIKHCGWWPDDSIRLVRKDKGTFVNLTHEKWQTKGIVKRLDVPIEHYVFKSYSDMVKIMQSRSTHMAAELYNSGKTVKPMTSVIHGLSMFIKIYFIQLGFLEGIDGLVIALTRAGGSFLKYAKLLELQRLGPTTDRI
jgi:glycosyltransferase involved in cell wall biosynthesis